ncbi:hypothetical protein VPARA_68460 [Variovorax paradoxus]|uniref:Uncharacterized protein n=1 Tax=Variovorax paradoxus TaxID=34073 RepID=A0A0H2LQT3_VARPD|nr:hypothetical protein VPARA_68460 [Variovorax paradoxus]
MEPQTPISAMLTQPVICASRIEMAPAAAMSPAVASPSRHKSSVPPISTTGRAPATNISEKRNQVETRPKSSARSRKPAMAPKATFSSCSAWAKSFTVLMLVMVSTTCPVTSARAEARLAERLRMRGRKKRISAT